MFKIVLFITLVLFSSCSNKNEQDISKINDPIQNDNQQNKNKSLLIWESAGSSLTFLEEMALQFQEETGVTVEVRPVSIIQMVNALKSNNGEGTADVFALPHNDISLISEMDYIFSHNDLDFSLDPDIFLPEVYNSLKYKNNYYGLPIAIETSIFLYNKNIFKVRAPQDFKDIIEFGKSYTNKEKNQYTIAFDIGDYYYSQSFLGIDGGSTFDKNNNILLIDSEKSISGIQKLLELKEISFEDISQFDPSYMMDLFTQGQLASLIGGPWLINTLLEDEVNLGIANLPTWNGKPLPSLLSTRTLQVSKLTKYPETAKSFLEFMQFL